jgi:cytochrome c oxidase cbb3-type subunit 3
LRLANSIDVSNDEMFWEMSGNSEIVAAGKATFAANCVSCHGEDLHGGIGFNLVDAEWVHGARPSEMFHTVDVGIVEKGCDWAPMLGQRRPEVRCLRPQHERPRNVEGRIDRNDEITRFIMDKL